jgi:CBS domain-containing protein
MAFYLVTKGQLHPYNFKYLEGKLEGMRLERTEVHSEFSKKIPKSLPKASSDFFAIDVMTKNVFSMNVNSLLKEVREKMQKENIRHIPITDNDQIVGMVSDRDLLKVDLSGTFFFLKASDVMTTLLIVANEETPLAHVARVLIEEKLSALPIVDKYNKLTGMISRTDILRTVIYNQLILK